MSSTNAYPPPLPPDESADKNREPYRTEKARESTPKRGCLFTFVIIAVIVFAMFWVASSVIKTIGVTFASSVGNLTNESNDLCENILAAGDADRRIAVIPVVGVIAGWGNYQIGEGAAYELARQLRAAAEDETVKAVLLEVNSPGGELTASDMLYQEILNLKSAGVKVAVIVDSLAASGGYYVIAPADKIFAQPTGMVGSFGVISQHFEVAQLLEKIGVKVEPLKSTGSKDLGSIFREMTAAERDIFAKILDTYHQRFVDIIASGRGIDREQVSAMATGEIFTAPDAVAKKLIDEIGYYDDAMTWTQKAIGGEGEVFTYEKKFDWRALIGELSSSAAGAAQPNLERAFAKFWENLGTATNGKVYLR